MNFIIFGLGVIIGAGIVLASMYLIKKGKI